MNQFISFFPSCGNVTAKGYKFVHFTCKMQPLYHERLKKLTLTKTPIDELQVKELIATCVWLYNYTP